MKTSNSKTDSQKLTGAVQMARRGVATAENRWQAAREQARAAKRRRKEVKLIARRAKKQAKEAKADLAEARKALAEAEAKLAKSGVRVAAGQPGKAKAMPVKRGVAATGKQAVPAPKSQTVQSDLSPPPEPAVKITPVPPQENASTAIAAQTGPA